VKMLPLMLESPYLQVQSFAANVLRAVPGDELQELGRMWSENHQDIRRPSVYDEYPDFPDHYASIGFPKYAGTEWFSPNDSDRSIGWSTKDDVATVAKWYGDTLHAEVMDAEKWYQVQMQHGITLVQSGQDPNLMNRMQQLMDRVMKGDQTALPEIDKLKEQLDQAEKKSSAAIERSIQNASTLSGLLSANARWIIAAKKGERISKLVIVFPIASLQRTAIKEVWDLSDYPSAWPAPKARTQ